MNNHQKKVLKILLESPSDYLSSTKIADQFTLLRKVMIAVPEGAAGKEHMKILQMLSRKRMNEEFRKPLVTIQTKEQALE